MTLREEINNTYKGYYSVDVKPEDFAEEIIILFEKLIDERMEKTKTIVIALSGAKVWEFIEPCYEDLKEELKK